MGLNIPLTPAFFYRRNCLCLLGENGVLEERSDAVVYRHSGRAASSRQRWPTV